MNGRVLRQVMAWIHGWLGLLAGWILFAMFLTGTTSYFRPEITRWMQPEVRLATVSAVHAAQTAITHMQRIAPNDEQWMITLPDERNATTRVFTRPRADAPKPTGRAPDIVLDPATGNQVTARETRGGEHFYRFHFQLQLPHPWGRWLAGLCAIFMLATIVSGVITHKRIFADFFRLRWGKGQRSWLDAHNVSAVVALPFHAMMTYTGLVALITMYMPWPILANYPTRAAFAAEADPGRPDQGASGRATPLTAIGSLVTSASREWRGAQPGRIIVRYPGDAAGTVTVVRSTTDTLDARGRSIIYAGVDGTRLSASPPAGPAVKTAGVMLGLHTAQFAGPVLRWMFLALGLSGAAMVGTGLVLWTAKRRTATATLFFGVALVERLNIAVIAALPAGMAAYLLANRLIPPGLAGRADMEVATMFWVWFGLSLATLLRPVRRAWIEVFTISGACFAVLPVVNALTTDRGFLHSIETGDWLFLSVDVVMIAIAMLFGFLAWRLTRKKSGGRAGPLQQEPLTVMAPERQSELVRVG